MSTGVSVRSSTSITRRTSAGAGSRFADSVTSSCEMPAAAVASHSAVYHSVSGQVPRRLITVRIFFSAMTRPNSSRPSCAER